MMKSIHDKRSEMSTTIITWDNAPVLAGGGDKLALRRMCECGCDARLHPDAVGYLIGCGPDGSGVTIFIEDEDVYRRLEALT